LIFLQVFASDVWIWYPFWILVGGVFILERVVSVWSGGWAARALAATLIPELLYDSYLDIIFLKGALDIAFKRQAQWGHEAPGDRVAVASSEVGPARAQPATHKNTSNHHKNNSHAHGKHQSHSKGHK
jgi:hypothetical protein